MYVKSWVADAHIYTHTPTPTDFFQPVRTVVSCTRPLPPQLWIALVMQHMYIQSWEGSGLVQGQRWSLKYLIQALLSPRNPGNSYGPITLLTGDCTRTWPGMVPQTSKDTPLYLAWLAQSGTRNTQFSKNYEAFANCKVAVPVRLALGDGSPRFGCSNLTDSVEGSLSNHLHLCFW